MTDATVVSSPPRSWFPKPCRDPHRLDQEDELSAAIELRRLFPGITDNAQARARVRTIAGWIPLPAAACRITPLRLRRSRARPAKP
jgi:hypothetical protein